MTFSYVCLIGHPTEQQHAPGRAPRVATCTCARPAHRDFHRDFSSQRLEPGDPFRQYDLSTRKERAQQEQGRLVDAPRDNFERRRLEREHGRVYVGDDTSGMTKRARNAISRLDRKGRV